MKILVTIDFPPEQGGIQRYLFNLVKYTYDPSDCVLVGYAGKKVPMPSLPCRIRYCFTFLSRFNKKFSLFCLLFALLKKVVCRDKQLTVEAGNIYSAIPVYLLSLILPVEYSVYCYGKEILPLREKGWRAVLFTRILKRAGKIGYISQHTATLLSGRKLDHKLIYLPPKIDRTLLVDVNDRKLHEPVQLLSVGRLVGHKGHTVLIDAVASLPVTVRCNLFIVGSGPQYSILKNKINALSLDDKITLTGELTDEQLYQLYKNSDIFLFPSQECRNSTEGFGIVLLEAMAQGLAILASKVGGIPEVLNNGSCGMLIPDKKVEAWVEGIIEIIKNDYLRKKLIVNARYRVEQYYVWN